MRNSLFAFVGPKDPFVAGEIAEELSPGPVLSILSARSFTDLFLFHTPHTADSAKATVREVRHRYPACRVELYDLPVSDPKDYSAIMGVLGRRVRKIVSDSMDCNHSVCVSSGTAEMRAAWFLLYAAGVLPARLLQVGSPAEPLFGAAAVKDVSLNGGDWHTFSGRPDNAAGLLRRRFRAASSREKSHAGTRRVLSPPSNRQPNRPLGTSRT